jgi:primosomal protein N'
MSTHRESLFQVDEPPPAAFYARVAVERGIDNESEGLTYSSPAPAPAVGERVEVPLGRKQTAGIVVAVGGPELLDGLSPSKVKPITRRSGAALAPNLVALAQWMAA